VVSRASDRTPTNTRSFPRHARRYGSTLTATNTLGLFKVGDDTVFRRLHQRRDLELFGYTDCGGEHRANSLSLAHNDGSETAATAAATKIRRRRR